MAIRSTRSSIDFWMRIALTQRNTRTPHAHIVTTRVRGMLRASVRHYRSLFRKPSEQGREACLANRRVCRINRPAAKLDAAPRTERRALDGIDQRMQVPRLDRFPPLEDQAAQGEHVVLGDPLEEILGYLERQMHQSGRWHRRVQSLPGQVQPSQPDPRRAVNAGATACFRAMGVRIALPVRRNSCDEMFQIFSSLSSKIRS